MSKNLHSEDATLQVDINEATLAVKEKRFANALSILEINISKYPDHIDSLYLAAVSARYLKKYEESRSYIESLLINAPNMGRAYQELGHLNKAINNIDDAIGNYIQACELNPALLGSWNSLYNLFTSKNNRQAAEHALEQINKLKKLPNILLYIDQIMNEDRLGVAEIKSREFLKKNPTHTYAMAQLAEIASRLGHYDDAELLLEKATSFEPDNGDLRMKYLLVLRKTQKFAKTTEQVNILCKKFPDNFMYKSQQAIEMMQSGNNKNAINIFNNILQESPNNYGAFTSKGHAEKTLGKTDDAIKSYQNAYKIKSDHGEAFFSLSNLKTYSFSDHELHLMNTQLNRVDLSLREKSYFHFALAQGYESQNNYELAFNHFKLGNKIKNDQSKYSISGMNDEFESQIEICNQEFFNKLGTGGCQSTDPIFILGLPRSGSTLIEQILASHSMIDGTLELPNILSLAHSLRGDDVYGIKGNYPKTMKDFTEDQRLNLGKSFINDTKIHRRNAPMFTDKMPNNFRHIGLIHLILPNAKIIDARRYPLDCCFSMFKQLFAQGQEFTYGLSEAANYYNGYVKLMNHWDDVLPGKVLRVNNEDVIDDLDGQVKRILNFLEVPFEENCISFYETDRSVRTASSEQVRQPINKKGQGRWKPYAKHLKPLTDVLDKNLLHQEDIDLINS
ncbi:sulfotransferase [Gammaproteobacteria bacterium]|nr:sulfotransferase [Gammaproteobacteria bacterium]MDC3313253.1 sulfotransferase [Gammaproteobacteria bacterium]